MKLPGRNDPCSCGSGKKFKQCCRKKYVSKPADWHPSVLRIKDVPNWAAYQYIGNLRLRDQVVCMRCSSSFLFSEASFVSKDDGKHQIMCRDYPKCKGAMIEFVKEDSGFLGGSSDVEAEQHQEE